MRNTHRRFVFLLMALVADTRLYHPVSDSAESTQD